MKLHEDQTLFRQAIQATAQQIGIPEIYVEKDYWVTYMLWWIFTQHENPDLVFKGGTSLSKCYGLINRFSEDIDLILIRREGESNNQMTNKIRRISRLANQALSEEEIEGLTNKFGKIRKTAHPYPKVFKGNFGQVRDRIVVEASWLGFPEPFESMRVKRLILTMILRAGELELAEKYGLRPFEVKTLRPQRTLCEKIMSLIRFSHGEHPLVDLRSKVRHCYDLHYLLAQDDIAEFFESDGFETMLNRISAEDRISYGETARFLSIHPSQALLFADTQNTWNELEKTYLSDFRKLTFGDFAGSKEIIETLIRIGDRLKKVKWEPLP